MNRKSKDSEESVERFKELASLITDERATRAFMAAALNDRAWPEAKADPIAYFNRAGVAVPPDLEVTFTGQEFEQPWPPLNDPALQTVVVRCWWVWGKVDKDDNEPVRPFRFCLEVPTSLLAYIRGFQRGA